MKLAMRSLAVAVVLAGGALNGVVEASAHAADSAQALRWLCQTKCTGW